LATPEQLALLCISVAKRLGTIWLALGITNQRFFKPSVQRCPEQPLFGL
jgi:hypothetical protein